MLRKFTVAIVTVIGLSASQANTPDQTPHGHLTPEYDILCKEEWSGTKAEIPAPFSDWITILCMPDGQRLAADSRSEPRFWLDHKTKKPFLLSAFPPLQTQDREKLMELGPSGLRFTRFSGKAGPTKNYAFAMNLFQKKFSAVKANEIETVYQLDAQSSWNDEIYTLFFYLDAGEPRHLITCAYNCRLSVSVDIATTQEAQNPGDTEPKMPI